MNAISKLIQALPHEFKNSKMLSSMVNLLSGVYYSYTRNRVGKMKAETVVAYQMLKPSSNRLLIETTPI